MVCKADRQRRPPWPDKRQLGARWLFDAMAHPSVLLDADHRVIAANRAALERLGRAEREVVGKHCWEVFFPGGPCAPPPNCLVDAAARAGPSHRASSEVEIPSLGGTFRVCCTALFGDDGCLQYVVHQATDVSEQLRSQQAALDSERLFRTLFEGAGDYVVLADPAKAGGPTIIDANRSACERLGYGWEELVGKPLADLHDPTSRALAAERTRHLLAGEALSFESVHLGKDGSRIPVEVSATVVQVGGRPLVLAIEHEITEHTRAEAECRRLHAQLLQAQKLESLGVVASGIAHDFNNLLAGILGNAELLQRHLANHSSLGPRVADIATSAIRAAELVRQMLVYAGHGSVAAVPVALLGLVEEMAGLLEAAISSAVTVQIEAEPDVPVIEADAGQIRQVVMNLITNAAESMGRRGGAVQIHIRSRLCDAEYLRRACVDNGLAAGRYVILEVSDTGVGMSSDTLEQIFQPFYTTKSEGRGLGLAAVVGIVRSHRGAIAIESAPGHGTCVRVLLPAAEGTSRPPPMPPAVLPWGAGRRILVADDDPVVRAMAACMLEDLGFTLLTASSGHQAADLCRTSADTISAVLLDVSMPGMESRACVTAIRQTRAEVPVVLMSGHDPAEIRRRVADGAPVLAKPFQIAELSRLLRGLLESGGERSPR